MNLHDAAAAVLAYSLQSGLLLVTGLLLPRLIRLRHPRTLLVYWQVLLVVVLVLPLVVIGLVARAGFAGEPVTSRPEPTRNASARRTPR